MLQNISERGSLPHSDTSWWATASVRMHAFLNISFCIWINSIHKAASPWTLLRLLMIIYWKKMFSSFMKMAGPSLLPVGLRCDSARSSRWAKFYPNWSGVAGTVGLLLSEAESALDTGLRRQLWRTCSKVTGDQPAHGFWCSFWSWPFHGEWVLPYPCDEFEPKSQNHDLWTYGLPFPRLTVRSQWGKNTGWQSVTIVIFTHRP